MQRECRSRIKANGKMVDANGKPFEKKVNAAAADEPEKADREEPRVGSIYSHAVNALNW